MSLPVSLLCFCLSQYRSVPLSGLQVEPEHPRIPADRTGSGTVATGGQHSLTLPFYSLFAPSLLSPRTFFFLFSQQTFSSLVIQCFSLSSFFMTDNLWLMNLLNSFKCQTLCACMCKFSERKYLYPQSILQSQLRVPSCLLITQREHKESSASLF